MTSNESLFGLARQFQFAVGASQDLDIIVQIFRTVLHSANTLPVPTETKKGRPHKLTKAEKKKLQDEAELQQVVVRQMHILKLYENSTQQQPPQYSQCLPWIGTLVTNVAPLDIHPGLQAVVRTHLYIVHASEPSQLSTNWLPKSEIWYKLC